MQHARRAFVVLLVSLGWFVSGCGSESSEEPPAGELPTLGARSPAVPPPPESLGGGSMSDVGENPWLSGSGLGGAPATGGASTGAPDASGSGSVSGSGSEAGGVGAGGASASGGAEPGTGGTSEPPPIPELLITQYVEGLASDKALELTNVGASDAQLSQCELQTFANGGTSPYRKSTLEGSLAPGASLVICGSNASPVLEPSCDAVSPAVAHNGDDAFVLRCGDVVVDSLGRVGEDPGNAWSGGELSTKDANLERKCAVAAGDATPDDAFSPETEWSSVSLSDLSDLGTRDCAALGAGGAAGE